MSNFYYAPQPHHSHSAVTQQHNPHHAHNRTRRHTRTPASNNNHHHNQLALNSSLQQHQQKIKALRQQQKEAEDAAAILMQERLLAYRREFDAAREFDMKDDETFCPFGLMTEDDLHSMDSSFSDRSSLSSGSPYHSPLLSQSQPAYLPPPINYQSAYSSPPSSVSSSNTLLMDSHNAVTGSTPNKPPVNPHNSDSSSNLILSGNNSPSTSYLQPSARRMGGKAIPIVDPSTGVVTSPPSSSLSPNRLVSRPMQVLPTTRVW